MSEALTNSVGRLAGVGTTDVAAVAERILVDSARQALERLELARGAPEELRGTLYLSASNSLAAASKLALQFSKALHRPAPKSRRATPPIVSAARRDLGQELHEAHLAAGLDDEQAATALQVGLKMLTVVESGNKWPGAAMLAAAERCPWVSPALLRRLRAAAEYVTQTAAIGADLSDALLSARERAELTESEAARSAGMGLRDYQTFEAGERRVKIGTAERVGALPWVGADLGDRIVAAVRADIDRRTALHEGRMRGDPNLVR